MDGKATKWVVSLEDGAATGLGDAGKGMAAGGMYAVQGGPSWMDGWCMRGSDGWCSIGGQTRCVSVVVSHPCSPSPRCLRRVLHSSNLTFSWLCVRRDRSWRPVLIARRSLLASFPFLDQGLNLRLQRRIRIHTSGLACALRVVWIGLLALSTGKNRFDPTHSPS